MATLGKSLPQRAELAVLRPEIVAPHADAVGLVDGDERQLRVLQELAEAVRDQPLGGDVEQLQSAACGPDPGRSPAPRRSASCRSGPPARRTRSGRRPGPSSAKSAARPPRPARATSPPEPGSTGICRRRSAERRSHPGQCRDAPSPPSAEAETPCIPSISLLFLQPFDQHPPSPMASRATVLYTQPANRASPEWHEDKPGVLI